MSNSPAFSQLAPRDVPFQVIWYEDPTAAAKALGVDVELPDLGITDPEVWARFDRKAWREALKGRVAMSDDEIEQCDPDWIRLAVFSSGNRSDRPIELWFDLEDGIVFRCAAGTLGEVVVLIQSAAQRGGLSLSNEWPGCVTAMQTRMGSDLPRDEQLAPLIEGAGFRWKHPLWQLMVPSRVH